MGVLVKVVYAAVASGQDPKVEVRRRLLNYRNTPHPSTGKTPAELMIRRQIRTRLPVMMKPTTDTVDVEAKKRDKMAREKRKLRFDKAKHAKEQEIEEGDRVLIKQQKTSTKPPYDPKPYTVVEVKGTQVTARRGEKERKRNKVKVKVVKERPLHLQPPLTGGHEEDTDSELDIYLPSDRATQVEQGQGPVQEAEAPTQEAQQAQEEETAGVRRSGRKRRLPKRY